jgi:hypothetical protein
MPTEWPPKHEQVAQKSGRKAIDDIERAAQALGRMRDKLQPLAQAFGEIGNREMADRISRHCDALGDQRLRLLQALTVLR